MKLLIITQGVDEHDVLLGFFVGWIQRFAERLGAVQVVAQWVGAHGLNETVRVRSLGKERGAGRWYRQLALQRLLARILFQERSADVILCHMCPEYAVAAYPIARAARVPVFLWYTHGQSSRRLRLAHGMVDGVLTASRESFPFPSAKAVPTGHGIDTARFRPLEMPSNPRKILLSIGRLSPVKAQDVAIRALARLVREHGLHDVELRIVGEVPMPSQHWYGEALRRMVATEALEQHVRFVGGIPHAEVLQHIAACDAVVSASRTGSLDKAPLEGMACGRPVLVSGKAFRAEMAGFEDLLMFREDDCADLADKLSRVLRTERRQMEAIAARLSQQVRQRHDLDGLIDRLLRVFRAALPPARAGEGYP